MEEELNLLQKRVLLSGAKFYVDFDQLQKVIHGKQMELEAELILL